MSFSKPQVSFSSNFAWLFSVMKYNSSVLFQVKRWLYTSHKRDQSKCKCCRLFSARSKIHQILVLFETKSKFFFKFYTTLWYHQTYFLHTFLAETLYTFCKSSPSILVKFHLSSQSLAFCTVVGSFSKNHIKFQLKNYRRLIFHDNEE